MFFRAARSRRSRCSTPASGCFPASWADPNPASRRVSRRAGSNIPITRARVNGRGGAFPTCCCPAITRGSSNGGARRRSGSRGSGGPIFASDEIRRLSFCRRTLDAGLKRSRRRSRRRRVRFAGKHRLAARNPFAAKSLSSKSTPKRNGNFACERENFACERKTFRFGVRKPLILLGREIGGFAVRCDFKGLRRIRLRAVFALRAAPPGAAFGENFAGDGEALETFFHLVSLVGEPERRRSPEMELTLRQLAQLLDDPQESRDRRGLAGVDLGAEQFLGLLQTRDLQKRVVGGGIAFASREFLRDDLLNAADAQPFGFRDLPQTATVHHRSVDVASALGFFARRYRLDVRVGHGGASNGEERLQCNRNSYSRKIRMHFFRFRRRQ